MCPEIIAIKSFKWVYSVSNNDEDIASWQFNGAFFCLSNNVLFTWQDWILA